MNRKTAKFLLLALFFVGQAVYGVQAGCEIQILFAFPTAGEEGQDWIVNYQDLGRHLQALADRRELDHQIANQVISDLRITEALGKRVSEATIGFDHCKKVPIVEFGFSQAEEQLVPTQDVVKLALAAAGEQQEQQQPVQQTVVVQGGQKSSWLTTALRYVSAPLMAVSWPAALAAGVASSFTDRGGGKTGDKADKISGRGQAVSASVHEPFPGAKVVTRPGYSKITLN